ncbi:MAG: hypothetical protein B7Z55_10045 [Planctomycetales bacterium 12-60-4]|nr:MAG: hypothetical protein B7Z55_10045 [Planctomycetales bacterium 12-60-4]
MTVRPLIVGIGSPHGDDQAGWCVINDLLRRGAPLDSARSAKIPTDILDWSHVDRPLILCDACQDGRPPGTISQWSWPDDPFPQRTFGTHDYPLDGVLSLGVTLGCIPNRVTIWTISVDKCESMQEPAPTVTAASETIAARLWEDLQHA